MKLRQIEIELLKMEGIELLIRMKETVPKNVQDNTDRLSDPTERYSSCKRACSDAYLLKTVDVKKL
ncbi:MAG: hypothetical protein QXU99_01165 [Candidatus Bathyarchaeia archaeon]